MHQKIEERPPPQPAIFEQLLLAQPATSDMRALVVQLLVLSSGPVASLAATLRTAVTYARTRISLAALHPAIRPRPGRGEAYYKIRAASLPHASLNL
jgi:hypothetical protein